MAPGYDSRQARTRLAGLTKPDPKEQAAQIVAWAICWPWNLVWTLCVYNPFRYVGEFLLRELQSALFEISNGQFSGIEQDLTLTPPPPPYPVPEPSRPAQTPPTPVDSPDTASTMTAVVSSEMPVAPTEAEPAKTKAESVQQVTQINVEQTTTAAESRAATPEKPDTQKESETPKTEQTADIEQVADIPESVEAELAEGGSSDSYTWAPPEPTAYVPLSDRPLKAVKYEAGTAAPATPTEKPAPAEPAADPWFEKHAPNQ